jgi:hypothetical protein
MYRSNFPVPWKTMDSGFTVYCKIWVILVGIVTRLWCGWSGVPFPAASYSMGTCGCFPGVKRLGHEVGHTHRHLVLILRMIGVITLLHLMPSWQAQGQLYLLCCKNEWKSLIGFICGKFLTWYLGHSKIEMATTLSLTVFLLQMKGTKIQFSQLLYQ